jgi:hypothetical protein
MCLHACLRLNNEGGACSRAAARNSTSATSFSRRKTGASPQACRHRHEAGACMSPACTLMYDYKRDCTHSRCSPPSRRNKRRKLASTQASPQRRRIHISCAHVKRLINKGGGSCAVRSVMHERPHLWPPPRAAQACNTQAWLQRKASATSSTHRRAGACMTCVHDKLKAEGGAYSCAACRRSAGATSSKHRRVGACMCLHAHRC